MTSMHPLSTLNSASVAADTLGFIPDSHQALTAELTRLAGHINAAQYRFLRLLAALIERNAWGGDSGMKTPAHWLNYYCGIDLGAAQEKVRVAMALPSLPLIEKAFASGALSYSKVRAMTRSATADNEDILLNVAKYGTAQHVEKLVRQHRRVLRLNCVAGSGDKDGTGDSHQTQHQARELNWYYDDDGMLVIRGRFAPEEGAVLVKALEAALDSVEQDKVKEKNQNEEGAADVSAETSCPCDSESTFPQKRADAMLWMTEHFLATRELGSHQLAIADKYQVLIHLDARSESALRQIGMPAHLDDGPPLPETTCKRLACDANLVPVLRDSAGDVLNIGRKTRVVPPAIRRALKIRDGGCRYPGCCQTRYVDAHHIKHWCDGGETSLDNLVLLCRHHHRLLHENVFSIAKVSNQVTGDRHSWGMENGSNKSKLRFLNKHGAEIKPALWPQFNVPSISCDGQIEIKLDNA